MDHDAPCNHTVDERALFGYWSDVEIINALYHGYKILQVYETITFNKTAYNTPEFNGVDFIKQVIFLKTLASDSSDYDEDVLQGLKDAKIIYDF